MKKIFALAIALVSMAAVMTSCNNDDADYIMQPAPVTEQSIEKKLDFDGKIYFGATDDQLQYINTIFNVTVNGETTEVNIESLPTTSNIPFLAELNEAVKAVNPTFFVYQIPASTKGEIKVSVNQTIKEGIELPEAIDMVRGTAINGRNSFSASNGLLTENLETLLANHNNKSVFTVTIK